MAFYTRERNSQSHTRGYRRGSAVMMAILALSALLFVVLAALWLANGALLLSTRQKRLVALRALSEAGLQYAYWQIVFNGSKPPQTYGPTSLGAGTFTVVVSDNTA